MPPGNHSKGGYDRVRARGANEGVLERCAGGLSNVMPPVLLLLRHDGRDLRQRFARSDGQTLVEYAMIVALIAVALIVVVGVLGGDLGRAFSTISNDL